jgi:hypothetical protein
MSEKRKTALIDQVFKVGNIVPESQAWFQSIYSFLRAKYRNIDVDSFNGVWRQFSVDSYLEKLKNIYTSHFTEDELQAILNFWVSPVGHKLLDSNFMSNYRQFSIDWAIQVEQALQPFVKEESSHGEQEIQVSVKER